jgi:hypothetical protein
MGAPEPLIIRYSREELRKGVLAKVPGVDADLLDLDGGYIGLHKVFLLMLD